MDIFKQASKIGLRFSTTKGSLSVEQIWQLTQADLSTCIKSVKKTLKKTEDADDLSFLDVDTTVDKTEQLRFDILKDIYLTKKAELEAARTQRDQKERNQKILTLIAEKKEGALKEKTVEELEAMLVD